MGKRDESATRRRIVDAAYESFWRSGFGRTSLDGIAARAGITKRTLYAYFRSKDDLLADVLEHYAELAMARIEHIGRRMPVGRDAMLETFFGKLAGWAAGTPRWSGSTGTGEVDPCPLTPVELEWALCPDPVFELGDLPGHPARAIARRAKAAMETWLGQRLVRARVAAPRQRAREIMLLMEGAMALTLIHGGRAYIDAACRAAKHLVRRRS